MREEPGKKGRDKAEAAKATRLKRPAHVSAKLEELRKTRGARILKRKSELKRRWGNRLISHPAIQAELSAHAWRMARLKRIQELSEARDVAQKGKLLERVNKLIDKEQARHNKRMLKLSKRHRQPESAQDDDRSEPSASQPEKRATKETH